MSTANLDATAVDGNLQQPVTGGSSLINEDVMQKIWDISKIPLPFTDMVGSGTAKNPYTEWTMDELAAPAIDNAVADGADIDQDDSTLGQRVGNHCQESVKLVRVSTRAQNTDNIGRSDELGYQVMRRQQELRRDVEASSIANTTSVADDNTNPGIAAGFPGWLATNDIPNGATAAGFVHSTKIVTASTGGTATPLLESDIRTAAQNVYEDGGNVTKLMAMPSVIGLLSQYMFTSSARIGTILSDQGKSSEKATAMGSVNVFVTDFGTLDFVPNRLQQGYGTNQSDVFLIDPSMVEIAYLTGYRTEPLAKTGLSDKRLMHVDWTLRVLNEKAHSVIRNVSTVAPVEA